MKLPAALPALALLTATAGAAPQEAVPEPTEAPAPAHLAAVSEERAARTVRELVALGPRMGGTRSGAAAAELLEARFEAMGLKTVRHLGREQWCHGEEAWEVRVRVGDDEPFRLERCWPWGFSPAGSGAGVPLTVGDKRSEPGGDRALLTDTYGGVRRKGTPSNVVLVDGANTIDGEWPVCRALRRQGTQAPTFGISAEEGKRLRAAVESGAPVLLDWSLETEVLRARPITVVATLPAAEGAPPGHFLICAHGDSDSGGPGANDNASGVAIVLEIARAWSGAVRAGDLPAPPREVRFAVWGTEIASTRAYLESELGAGVLGVLNFDQAGYGSTGQRLHLEPDDVAGNVAFIEAAGRVLRDRAGTAGFPERWATNKSLGGTDSYVFSGSRRFRDGGLPAVTMYTSAWGRPDEHPRTPGMPGESWRDRDRVEIDYDRFYHSAGDTPENTTDREPENMGWCARVGLQSALDYLGSLDADGPSRR
ncbi:MAG: M28 family peptidase [Planctomycetota bacterium]|jgi:hypothetical protein